MNINSWQFAQLLFNCVLFSSEMFWCGRLIASSNNMIILFTCCKVDVFIFCLYYTAFPKKMVAVKATFLQLLEGVRKMSIAVVIKKWFQPFRAESKQLYFICRKLKPLRICLSYFPCGNRSPNERCSPVNLHTFAWNTGRYKLQAFLFRCLF